MALNEHDTGGLASAGTPGAAPFGAHLDGAALRRARLGGAALIVCGLLILVRAVQEFLAGPPPASGSAILAWAAAEWTLLAAANEALFFAAVAMVPAVAGLHASLRRTGSPWAVTGCGIVAAVIPVIAMLDIVHGRLVFPVYGIGAPSPDVAEFIVAVFYGGLHAVGLLLGAAVLLLGPAMKRANYGPWVLPMAIAAGIGNLVGAYPWAIGARLTLTCWSLFALWCVAAGAALYRGR